MLVYVDDLNITENIQIKIQLIKKNLNEKFEIKDLGNKYSICLKKSKT
jgi:hypothetical protein